MADYPRAEFNPYYYVPQQALPPPDISVRDAQLLPRGVLVQNGQQRNDLMSKRWVPAEDGSNVWLPPPHKRSIYVLPKDHLDSNLLKQLGYVFNQRLRAFEIPQTQASITNHHKPGVGPFLMATLLLLLATALLVLSCFWYREQTQLEAAAAPKRVDSQAWTKQRIMSLVCIICSALLVALLVAKFLSLIYLQVSH